MGPTITDKGYFGLLGIFGKSATADAAHKTYVTIVNHARGDKFYLDCGVPDTPDGRFDMILLHAFLLYQRLKIDAEQTAELGQAVFDLLFADMDQCLREMGVGDMGVGRRIKGMAEAFYGRLAAYEKAILGSDSDVADVLVRNLYQDASPTASQVERIVSYIRRELDELKNIPIEEILAGNIRFGRFSES